jgi:hypothetical protein
VDLGEEAHCVNEGREAGLSVVDTTRGGIISYGVSFLGYLATPTVQPVIIISSPHDFIFDRC